MYNFTTAFQWRLIQFSWSILSSRHNFMYNHDIIISWGLPTSSVATVTIIIIINLIIIRLVMRTYPPCWVFKAQEPYSKPARKDFMPEAFLRFQEFSSALYWSMFSWSLTCGQITKSTPGLQPCIGICKLSKYNHLHFQ